MDIDAILKELEYIGDDFPREALEAAVAQQEAITPHLLNALEDATRNVEQLAEPGDEHMLHFYAFYLLAQFREERAYPLMVEFFSVPGEASTEATGDLVTEDLGRVLASVSGGDMTLMQRMVENPQLDEYVRAAALSGMLCLVANDLQPRETVVEYLHSLFQGGLEREYSFVWDELVFSAVSLYPEELMPGIRQAFADDLIDDSMPSIALKDVERCLAEGKPAALARLHEHYYQLIDDTICEMEDWDCYQPQEPLSSRMYEYESLPPAPVIKKPGRNEPCPCGSGKKYKHCCLRK